jgi:inorganic phosphate transporter, PiT family
MSEVLSPAALIALIIVALSFDFLNGLHDTANSIATIVSTRMLRPHYAVIWAAFFNFVAFLFFGLHVARTIGVGIVSADVVDPRVIFGALMGAISWNLLTWWRGIPSSSSHALIGGLLGAGVTKAGMASIVWSGVLTTGVFIVLSPTFGFFLALLLVLAVSWTFVRASPRAVEGVFQWLQFAAASLISLGHGGNDAQKTMGIIAVLLFSQGKLGSDFSVPFWVVITCQAAIALGTLVGGWRIVHTVGSKITRLTTVQGCCASTGGAVMLFAATYLGISVSTTHTVTGSVIGVGAARKVSAVRWRVATDIVIAWIVTLPASGLMAACFYLLSGPVLPGAREIGHLVFVTLLGFVTFGSVAVMFASVIGVAIWLLSKLFR